MNEVRILIMIWSTLSAAAPAMLLGRPEPTLLDTNWTGTDASSERTCCGTQALRRKAWLAPPRLPRVSLAKSWPNVSWENTTGSQALTDLGLASRVSFQAEGMGFEPEPDFASSDCPSCSSVDCEMCRAANALHSGRFKWLEPALNDADLQRVVAAWANLPEPIRAALVAMVATFQTKPQ